MPRSQAMTFAAASILFVTAAGCDDRTPDPHGIEQRAIREPSPWRTGPDESGPSTSAAIAIPSQNHPAALEAAIEKARATADEARERWAATPSPLRVRWAVKWAVETSDGGTEHLWVQPIEWSPFRVEGLLASEPVNEPANLPRGRTFSRGDLVNFPIDELADWVHYLDSDPKGRREGGFTIEALEERYGRP